MKSYTSLLTLIGTLTVSIFYGCNKYLDAKTQQSLTVPSTVADLWAIIDNTTDMNQSPSSGDMSADDYYLPDDIWSALPLTTYKNLYRWDGDVYNDNYPNDYVTAFKPVYKSNLVLDNIGRVNVADSLSLREVRGSALFYRAKAFWDAAEIWSKGYNAATATIDLGIPLRLSPDFNEISVRASTKETYDRITSDLHLACSLLPVNPVHVMRPSKTAAYGMLARVYLAMGIYDMAEDAADSSLSLYADLLDFNTLNTAATYPFTRFNKEVIFNCYESSTSLTNGRIDSLLYQSYDNNDFRKTAYFKMFAASVGGGYGFKGSYWGSSAPFSGIATDEIYLIKAECAARRKDNALALSFLNRLLYTRYKQDSFIPYTTDSIEDVLGLVLKERRKELFFRSVRWSDLKRLNKEGYNISIQRFLLGQEYILPPNDSKYAIHYPESVIHESKVIQNN